MDGSGVLCLCKGVNYVWWSLVRALEGWKLLHDFLNGLVFDEWIPVDKHSMLTRFQNVYAIGDVIRASVHYPASKELSMKRELWKHCIWPVGSGNR